MSYVRLVVLGGIILGSFFQGGCSGCNEEYYCDETGCYWCDSYGCRPVDPPARADCAHGDYECPPDRPFCTEDGYCVGNCSVDADCPTGLRCISGFCLEPDVVTPPPMHPGYCGGTTACGPGEYCAPSTCCLPVGGIDCCASADCAGGLICDEARHECLAPPADAGTDDAGVPPDATSDGPPPPPPACRSNADCVRDYGDHYLCIDGVCKLPCRTDAECGAGCHCVGGFCASE